MYYLNIYIETLNQMLKICRSLLITIILHLILIRLCIQGGSPVSVYDKVCLNGYVKWTDKINHFGHIVNVNLTDSKRCGLNGAVKKLNSNFGISDILCKFFGQLFFYGSQLWHLN